MNFKKLIIMIICTVSLSSITVYGKADAKEQQETTEANLQPTVLQQANEEENEVADPQAISSYWEIKNHGKTGKKYSKWKIATEAVKSNASGVLVFSQSYTSSNSWTGTLKVAKKKIDASVGFNITKSYTQTAGINVNVKKNKTYKIYYRRVYNQYKVQQQQVNIDNWTGKITRGKKYYIYPKKFSHIQHKAVEK